LKFEYIKQNREYFSVEEMCRILNVSKSGYYKWLTPRASRRTVSDEELLRMIKEIFKNSMENYGSPRITQALHDLGYRVGKNRVARIMRENHIFVRIKPQFKVKTTDSNHDLPISPNLLEQNFDVPEANSVWASDITYVRVGSKWFYLCVILDLFNREVVGYTFSPHMKTSMVIETLHKAMVKKQPGRGLIFHSDRGSQYASLDFRRWMKYYGFKQSMSGKGNCYDNAAVESFFGRFKVEEVYKNSYKTFEHARERIFYYIECFYNRKRIHSSNNGKSPFQYVMKLVA